VDNVSIGERKPILSLDPNLDEVLGSPKISRNRETYSPVSGRTNIVVIAVVNFFLIRTTRIIHNYLINKYQKIKTKS
jgi:hypothetical protein